MTISNETKVGVLTAIAIVLLILGFNFLKGKNIGGKNAHYFAVFSDIQGLNSSNPVVINGKQVGNINKTDGGKDMRRIVVDINMTVDVIIPSDAVALISKSLLGTVELDIRLGNSTTALKSNDTLKTIMSGDLIGDATVHFTVRADPTAGAASTGCCSGPATISPEIANATSVAEATRTARMRRRARGNSSRGIDTAITLLVPQRSYSTTTFSRGGAQVNSW